MNNGLFLNSDDDAPGSGIRFGESKPLFDPDDPKPHVVGPTASGVLNWEWNAAYNDMRRREAGVNLQQNKTADHHSDIVIPFHPEGADVDKNICQAAKIWNPFDYVDLVDSKKQWDYKRISPDYEDFGNFNYARLQRL